ncbi:unannotated protein [freshwater metagenome]|uniref:Unannotated protein n=1 Tax=freshwater metagenome TaxID=449393 RepID=A0A6J6UUA0_9ZZZZ
MSVTKVLHEHLPPKVGVDIRPARVPLVRWNMNCPTKIADVDLAVSKPDTAHNLTSLISHHTERLLLVEMSQIGCR